MAGGQLITSATGTLSASATSDRTVALSGIQIVSSSGALASTGPDASRGQQITLSQGVFGVFYDYTQGRPLTGSNITAGQGTFVPSVSGVALTGSTGAFSTGAVVFELPSSNLVVGLRSNKNVAPTSDISWALTGVSSTVSQGIFPRQVSRILDGSFSTLTLGAMTGSAAGAPGTVALTGTTFTGSTGAFSASGGTITDSGYFTIPSQTDEQNTYTNVLGWAWTTGDKTPEHASTAPTISVSNIHGDTEGDDFWAHYQQYRRTEQGNATSLSWSNAWRTWFTGTYYTQLTTTDGPDFNYDHIYSSGAAAYGHFENNAACKTLVENLATLIETKTASWPQAGTPGEYFYWGLRQYGRWLQVACNQAQLNPIPRWTNLLDKVINNLMLSTDWEDKTNSPIRFGGMYFTSGFAGPYTDSGITEAQYAAGRRGQSSFSTSILVEGFWRAWLITGRTDVKNRLIEMAKFAYYYAHNPSFVNVMCGSYYGHDKGGYWTSHPGGAHTNPNTSPTDCSYDTSQVNTLVFGYKLTGHKGMLRRAHIHLRKGTQYTDSGYNPNPGSVYGETKKPDNEVDHFLDTQVDTSSGSVQFGFNKGELQYAYQVFENGGVPALINTWPPYTVPTTSGQVVNIGTNYASDVRPAINSAAEWNYALFGYYGGGALIEDFSHGGAYAITGSGGHAVPPNLGSCYFDFQDAMWKRKDNANGVAARTSDFPDAEIDSTYGEIIAATTAGIPAPAHLYAFHMQRRGANRGTLGSHLLLRSQSSGFGANRGSSHAHSFNMSTGLWTRLSTNSVIQDGVSFRGAAYDAATNRYYMIRFQMHYSSAIDYLDGNDWTWKTASLGTTTDKGENLTCFVDNERHLLVMVQQAGTLRVWDLDNLAGGETMVPMSGTLPTYCQSDFHLYPRDGSYYTHEGMGNATLLKITPPAIGLNPLTATWACSTRTLTSALRTQPADRIISGAVHNTRFFYVPSLDCFAWIPGEEYPVQLIKP